MKLQRLSRLSGVNMISQMKPPFPFWTPFETAQPGQLYRSPKKVEDIAAVIYSIWPIIMTIWPIILCFCKATRQNIGTKGLYGLRTRLCTKGASPYHSFIWTDTARYSFFLKFEIKIYVNQQYQIDKFAHISIFIPFKFVVIILCRWRRSRPARSRCTSGFSKSTVTAFFHLMRGARYVFKFMIISVNTKHNLAHNRVHQSRCKRLHQNFVHEIIF